MILAGDVGGTKAVLALYEQNGSVLEPVYKETYLCAEYRSFSQILNVFIETTLQPKLSAACFGIAGPIENGDCYATNLEWTITQKNISEILDTCNVCLINDLEATAWGVLGLNEESFIELNPVAKKAQGHVAVIAAGTGLGEAIMCWDGTQFHAIATEGGHTGFAPNNAQESALLEFMRNKHPDHVSYERLVSGQGLHNIYQFLKQSRAGFAASEAVEEAFLNEDPASVIGEAGISGSDQLSQESLRLFSHIYGSEAGNLALKCLPSGGVYVAGGIATKILPMLKEEYFMQGFLSKGRYFNILQKFPVKVCLNPEAALYGAYKKALALL